MVGTVKHPPGVMLNFEKMRPICALLSAKDRGDLLLMILDYAELEQEPELRPGSRLESVWPHIRKMIDQDSAAYQNKCDKAKKAAQARWNRKRGEKKAHDHCDDSSACESMRTHADAYGRMQTVDPYKDYIMPKRNKRAQNEFAQPALPPGQEELPMQFDFAQFSKIAATAYPKECQYTLEQCLDVFRCYFQTYEDYIGCPHPPIRREQITQIMEAMPCIVMEDRGENLEPLDPEDYTDLIDLHFKTQYQNCDYNINHFFSGRIREMRFYDAEKGYE